MTATVRPDDSQCPICSVGAHEVVLHETPEFLVMNTKFMKGHKERFMVVLKRHVAPGHLEDDLKARGYRLLWETAAQRIGLDAGFILLEDRHSSIPDHWHQVACDLLRGEDYEQVVDTPRLVVTREHPDGLHLEPGQPHAPLD